MAYDFDAFLSTIKYLDKEDILVAAYKKHKSLDKSSTMYTMEARLNFQKGLSGLLFFLENGERLPGLLDHEFASLKPVCESLIRKGQMDKDVIKLFE
jgi:hypothetical protein